jgi:HK97 family phage major capsid protein
VTNGISDGPASTLLDYPVYLNTAVPQLATGNKSLIFGDFNCYVYREIQNSFAVMRLTELLAQKREVGYLGFYRTDGRVVDNTGLVYAANA